MLKKITRAGEKNNVSFPKALVLFSGGLDSLLAALMLQKINFPVTGLAFKSCFFNTKEAREIAKKNNLNLIEADISAAHLKITQKPQYGYGKNINPCLDCHLLMFKKAKKIAEKKGFRLIVSGEVLGQRPFSQNLAQFKLIEKASQLEGKILRPLSARLLPVTNYEKEGLFSRKELGAISGKSRQKQLQLVKKYKIKYYRQPGGGCILTDPGFSQKLKELFRVFPCCGKAEINLLRTGRIFFEKKTLIVIGRNEKENNLLKKFFRPSCDSLLELKNYQGPLLLMRNLENRKNSKRLIKKWGAILGWYYPRIRASKKTVLKLTEEKKVIYFRTKIKKPQ